MPRRLTPQSTLDNLKKEAKRWLRALRDNAAGARARLDRALPDAPALPTLRDIQHALAREHGLPGWTVLKELLARRALVEGPSDELVNRFLENACPDHHVRGGPAHVRARHTATRLLERYPEIAHASLAAEIVCGDVAAVDAALAARPDAAVGKVSVPSPERSKPGGGGRWLQRDMDRDLGAKGWEPLLYLCFTRLPLAAANDNAMTIARMLLDRGADPNAFFMAGSSRYTPLVGAIGEGEEGRPPHPHRDALVRLLLERGAEPYDIQVVYNIHFHGQVLWFLELIYERSVQLRRKADWDDPDWPMLDMGGYGNGARWHLWIAIQNNDVRLAEWCLAHGANPDPAPPRAKTLPQRSLFEEAVRRGCPAIAELLVQHGAPRVAVALESVEVFSGAIFRLDRGAAQFELARHPELVRDAQPMLEAARRDRVDVIAFLLELGVSPDGANADNEHPLHAAAYANAVRAAELLIARGAEIDPVEANWNNTPLASAIYAQHQAMIALLGRYSRDMWELVYSGQIERVRELLAENPEIAKLAGGGHTLLMWLPPQDEALALELARMLLEHGADSSLRNLDGQTAADRAAAQGMFEVAALLREAETPDGARPTVEGFERMAENLLAAYRTGAPEAMERHYAETWHRRAWPGMRRYTLLDLGRVPGPNDEYIDISLDDARLIVAREHRFENWSALTEYVTHLPAGKRIAARPVELCSDGPNDADRERAMSRDWDEAADLIATNHFSVLNAHGQMTDDALRQISRLADLTTLGLGGSKALTDAGVRHLSGMPQLRHLDLSGTQITDRGLEALRDLPNLDTISLAWTAITDAGVAALAPCHNLTRVDLVGTATGDSAIKALAGKAALRTLSTGNGVTDTGIVHLHAFPVFKTWQESGAPEASAEMDGGPNSLMLRGAITDRGLAALAGLDGLFGLNLWDTNLAITAAGLAPLARLPNLGRLAVEAHDETMAYIAMMPRLRFLMIQDTDAGDDGWIALSRSQSIEQIWGRRCHNLRSRGFRALAKMSALQNLAVSCKNVDDGAVATLPDFPSLREIMPMDIPDEGYRHIARCERLERLILMYCRDTTDRATAHITSMRHLKRYFASYTQVTDTTPELLSGIASLEDVELSACAGLTNVGIAALARLPNLRKLGLGGMPRVTREVIGLFARGVRVRYSG
jgi:ankyrin repeat protein